MNPTVGFCCCCFGFAFCFCPTNPIFSEERQLICPGAVYPAVKQSPGLVTLFRLALLSMSAWYLITLAAIDKNHLQLTELLTLSPLLVPGKSSCDCTWLCPLSLLRWGPVDSRSPLCLLFPILVKSQRPALYLVLVVCFFFFFFLKNKGLTYERREGESCASGFLLL